MCVWQVGVPQSMSQQPSKNRKDLSSLLAKSEFLSVEQLKEAIKDNTVSLKGSLWSICAYKSVPEKIGNKRAQTPSVLRVFPGKQALTITVGILTVDPGPDSHNHSYQPRQESVVYSYMYRKTQACLAFFLLLWLLN